VRSLNRKRRIAFLGILPLALSIARSQPPQDSEEFGALLVRGDTVIAHNLKHDHDQQQVLNGATRIVKGKPVPLGALPWVVALAYRDGAAVSQYCGGSLIKPTIVLTAAHCRVQVGDVVIAGRLTIKGDGGVEVRVRKVISGPYESRGMSGDYAMVLLEHRVDLQTIALDTTVDFYSIDGAEMKISGWGRPTAGGPLSNILLQANVRTKEFMRCQGQYNVEGLKVTDGMFCGTSDEGDACFGDSGGPAMRRDANGNYFLVGIISWGKECGQAAYPGVYTRIAPAVADFLEKSLDQKT